MFREIKRFFFDKANDVKIAPLHYLSQNPENISMGNAEYVLEQIRTRVANDVSTIPIYHETARGINDESGVHYCFNYSANEKFSSAGLIYKTVYDLYKYGNVFIYPAWDVNNNDLMSLEYIEFKDIKI